MKLFAKHSHEGTPDTWTYLQDELFIQLHPELREHLGKTVNLYLIFMYKSGLILTSVSWCIIHPHPSPSSISSPIHYLSHPPTTHPPTYQTHHPLTNQTQHTPTHPPPAPLHTYPPTKPTTQHTPTTHHIPIHQPKPSYPPSKKPSHSPPTYYFPLPFSPILFKY